MTSQSAPRVVGASDLERLRHGVAVANVPTLLMVLVQLTGQTTWLKPPFTPTQTRGLADHDSGGLPDTVQAEIRDAAYEAIAAWQAGAPVAIPDPDPELIVRMMSVCMGEPIPYEYGPMIRADLEALTTTSSGKRHREKSVSETEWPTVVIVGAGLSGVIAAAYLERAGIPFLILEKASQVGGTWHQNRYPGCGVDTPSHFYSFSFAPHDWQHFFASQDEVFRYIDSVVVRHDLRRHIRFQTEALSASYDPASRQWRVAARDMDGRDQTLAADILISAVGAFAIPKMPAIDGLDEFEGPVHHTADWPDDVDLSGKAVGVIGTGASAMQFVPATADAARSLTVFQRSPQWVAPFEQCRKAVPAELRYLLRSVPLYRAWYRQRLSWTFTDKIHASLQKDPDWSDPARSVNAVNDGHREFFSRYLREQLMGREDLIDAALPDYPPFGKRILLDNGWFAALRKDNVRLVTNHIDRVTPRGMSTASGETIPLDMLVLATGFDVARFLGTMEIRGRSGRTLRDTWGDDDAKAYLGCAIPDFPNFYCLYGPNTQTAGGSITVIIENQMTYVVSLIEKMAEHRLGSLEVRQEVHGEYNARVDEAHDRMIWTHPGFSTYYRNQRGRVVMANPFRMVDFWAMCQSADLADYESEPRIERETDQAISHPSAPSTEFRHTDDLCGEL